jgi:hypothetical protein
MAHQKVKLFKTRRNEKSMVNAREKCEYLSIGKLRRFPSIEGIVQKLEDGQSGIRGARWLAS